MTRFHCLSFKDFPNRFFSLFTLYINNLGLLTSWCRPQAPWSAVSVPTAPAAAWNQSWAGRTDGNLVLSYVFPFIHLVNLRSCVCSSTHTHTLTHLDRLFSPSWATVGDLPIPSSSPAVVVTPLVAIGCPACWEAEIAAAATIAGCSLKLLILPGSRW